MAKLYKRRKAGQNIKKPLKRNSRSSYSQVTSTPYKKRVSQKDKKTKSKSPRIALRSYSLSY